MNNPAYQTDNYRAPRTAIGQTLNTDYDDDDDDHTKVESESDIALVRRFKEYAFTAFNLPPRPERAHRLPTGIYGPEPTVITGYMMWKAPEGVTGIVPTKRPMSYDVFDDPNRVEHDFPAEQRADASDLYGLRIQDLIQQKRLARVDTFRIAYTVMGPPKESAWDRLPLVGFLHGVPMNRRAKYGVMRWLGRFAVCVCWDMLGMGESDMPLWYGTEQELQYWTGAPERSSPIPEAIDTNNDKDKATPPMLDFVRFNRRWDWRFDVPYVHQLMTQHIPRRFGFPENRRWIFQSDDWGTGIGMAYASSKRHTQHLAMLFLVNAVMLDGYFVIEIGTIGKMAEVFQRKPDVFSMFATLLPQTIVSIEKYMVKHRHRFNRYTESDFLFPYQDVDYQAGRMAGEMRHNEWALLCLANRASRLAPRQLQPYHRRYNPVGLKSYRMQAPVYYIWGKQDQMMPPSQVDRGQYLWPMAHTVGATWVENADHFVEIDQPQRVAEIMLRAINGLLGLGTTRVFLGLHTDTTYKGDELEFAKWMDLIYNTPIRKLRVRTQQRGGATETRGTTLLYRSRR